MLSDSDDDDSASDTEASALVGRANKSAAAPKSLAASEAAAAVAPTGAQAVDLRGMGEVEFSPGEEPTPPAVTPTPRGELRRLMQTMKRLNKAPVSKAKTSNNPAAEDDRLTTEGDSPTAKPTAENHEASSARRHPTNLNETSDSDSDASWLFATRTPRVNAEQPRKLSNGSRAAEAPATNVPENESLDKPTSPDSPVATGQESGEAEPSGSGRTSDHIAGSVATRTTTAEVKKVRAEVGVRVPVGASAEDAVLAARDARALLARPAVDSAGQLTQEHQERRGLMEPEPEPEVVPERDQQSQSELELFQRRPLQPRTSQSVPEPAGMLDAQNLPPYGSRPTSADRKLKRAPLLSSDSDTESDSETSTEPEATSRPVISEPEHRIPSRSVDAGMTNLIHREAPVVSAVGHGSHRSSDRLFVPDVSLDGSFGFETAQNDHGATESPSKRPQLPTQAVAATSSAASSQFSEDEDEDTESDRADDDSERSSGDESTVYPSSARQAVPEVEPDPISLNTRTRGSPSFDHSKSPPRNSSTFWRSRASPAGRGGMRGGRGATSAARGPARSLSWAEDDRLEETKWLAENNSKNNSTVWINDRRLRKAAKDTGVLTDAADAKADAIVSAAWQQARQEPLQMSGIESFSEHTVSGRLATILSAGSQSGESTASPSGLSYGSNISATAAEAPPPTPAFPISGASGDSGQDISAPHLAPLAASSSHPREGEVLSPILPAMTPVTPACGGQPAEPTQQLLPVQEVMSPELVASRPAVGSEHHEAVSGQTSRMEGGNVREDQIGSLLPSAHKPMTYVEQIELPQQPRSVRGPTPSSPQRSQVKFNETNGSSPCRSPDEQVQQHVFLRSSQQAWEQSKPVPAVPTSPRAACEQVSNRKSKLETGVPISKASIVPPSPPAGFKISMSEYRRHGLDPSSAWPSDPKEKENRNADVVSQVRVRPRNADVREQLQSAEFNLLDLRLAQQRGEAKVLVQQQQLLEDQVEQIALQRQQAARLGLAAVADALQPAESSIRAAAAEVLNRQQVQQEQAAAQAALVEEAGRWRRQMWAAQEAETWAATQERNRVVAALQARCASVATDVREASRLGLASADELAAAWAILDTASTLDFGPVGEDGHEADAISEHLGRVNELGKTWAHRLALGASATVANAGQRQKLLLQQQELQAQAQQLMEDEENWQQLQQRKHQQEQHKQTEDPELTSEREVRRRMALLSPRRRAGMRHAQQASTSPPPRQPLQVQTAAQTQAQAHVRQYQERFEQYQLEKAIQKEKAREDALQGKVKPPGGRHTAARALLRRRRRPAHVAAGATSSDEHAARMSSNTNQREEAAARISSKDEEIKRIQANALLLRKQQQEQELADDDLDGDADAGDDSPGTRDFRALLVASAAVRRSVSAGV